MTDPVRHPEHYMDCGTHLYCGEPIEVIDVTEGMSFVRGNVVKYALRAGRKGDAVEDLEKARWYLDREITRLTVEEDA